MKRMTGEVTVKTKSYTFYNHIEPRHDKTNVMRLRPDGSRPAGTSAQSDQDPCCSLTTPITSKETDSEQHGS
jgi:hypothetical protein